MKIHALVDRQGLPVRLGLPAGQAHDAPTALALLDRLEPRTIVLADKACDGNAIRDLIESHGAVPNIPANRAYRQPRRGTVATLEFARNSCRRQARRPSSPFIRRRPSDSVAAMSE